MRFTLAILGSVWLSAAIPERAVAADPVLVELFTSQGCSSCPPADEILGELAPRDDVIALSLHVDYWDYLGWKDVFSQEEFTNRQKRYAQAARSKMIYTPQVIVGGRESIVGTKAMKISEMIRSLSDVEAPVSLDLTVAGTDLKILIRAVGPIADDVSISVVQYSPEETVQIERGENAGRNMTYHNVVKTWKYLGIWNGEKPAEMSDTVDASMPVVVIAQDGLAGPVLASARLR